MGSAPVLARRMDVIWSAARERIFGDAGVVDAVFATGCLLAHQA
jgi:hypothetical protein